MNRLVIVAAASLCGAGLAMDSPASARPGGSGFGGGTHFAGAGVGSFHGSNIAGSLRGANITGRSVATAGYGGGYGRYGYGRYGHRSYSVYGAAGLGLLGLGLGYGLAAPYYGYGCPYIDAYGNCVGDPGYAYGW